MVGLILPKNSPFEKDHLISRSTLETRSLGGQLGKILGKNSIVCFFGDLGAGKTTFIKGLIAELTDFPPEQVNSPTFNYLNIYSGAVPIYHFDLYRLAHADDFLAMGFDEFFHAEGICCIEWSERIQEILPKDVLNLTLSHISNEERQIKLLLGSST